MSKNQKWKEQAKKRKIRTKTRRDKDRNNDDEREHREYTMDDNGDEVEDFHAQTYFFDAWYRNSFSSSERLSYPFCEILSKMASTFSCTLSSLSGGFSAPPRIL